MSTSSETETNGGGQHRGEQNGEQSQSDGEFVHLDVSEWDPPPKAKQQAGPDSTESSGNRSETCIKIPVEPLPRQGLAFEVIVHHLKEKIKVGFRYSVQV